MRTAPSIRRTVLVWQFAALMALGVVAVLATYQMASRSFAELSTLELAQIADAVARHGIDNDDSNAEQPGDFLSQVWDENGRLLYGSHEPPVEKPTTLGELEFRYDNQNWRGYAARYDGQTVLVARERNQHRPLFARLSLPLLGVLVLVTVALMMVLGLRMRRALFPLAHLRAVLAERSPSSLAPVDLPKLPVELRPLVATLNDVFSRQRELIASQRRFTADAAHELRTPITAIGLYAQLGVKDVDQLNHAALRDHVLAILASCQRAGALVEQLLLLARLDADPVPLTESFALDDLLRETVAALSVLADAGELDLGITDAVPLQIDGDRTEWRMLLDNLIGNAIRYTPRGGRIDIALAVEQGLASVCIDDSGPGIPEPELQQVFARFHRIAGTTQPGTGLGLAIVARIAQRQGVRVHLENRPEGGLRARIDGHWG